MTLTDSKTRKFIISHPSTAPFVQQAGRALYEADSLHSFLTTYSPNPESALESCICSFVKIFGYNLSSQLQRRAVSEFPLDFVKRNPLREALRTLTGKIDRTRILTDMIWEWSEHGFDHWVAENIRRDTSADGIYGFEHASLASFHAAQQRGIASVYDVPAPEHDFTRSLLEREMRHDEETVNSYDVYVRKHQERRTQRRRDEWKLASVVVANSNFTMDSYAAAGLDVSKVIVVPYGAPPAKVDKSDLACSPGDSVAFLWAGSFSIRKGAHYLVDAWKKLSPNSSATLSVYGAYTLPETMRTELDTSIFFSPTIPRSELYTKYTSSDLLVFPTLCDGFGMVVTEAFASGLPVLTTSCAGAADLVSHGENGFIVPAGDSDALAETLHWCINNKSALRKMRSAALKTAKGWQWSDYRESLTKQLQEKLPEP